MEFKNRVKIYLVLVCILIILLVIYLSRISTMQQQTYSERIISPMDFIMGIMSLILVAILIIGGILEVILKYKKIKVLDKKE